MHITTGALLQGVPEAAGEAASQGRTTAEKERLQSGNDGCRTSMLMGNQVPLREAYQR